MRFVQLRAVIVAVLVLTSRDGLAEGGCPPGMYPARGNGWQACHPIPGASNGAEPQERAGRWIDSWGALVGDLRAGAVGVAVGKPSREAASDEAFLACRQQGGSNCEILEVYRNSCVGVAGVYEDGQPGVGRLGIGVSALPDRADNLAIQQCRMVNRKECRIAYSACSPARLVGD